MHSNALSKLSLFRLKKNNVEENYSPTMNLD